MNPVYDVNDVKSNVDHDEGEFIDLDAIKEVEEQLGGEADESIVD